MSHPKLMPISHDCSRELSLYGEKGFYIALQLWVIQLPISDICGCCLIVIAGLEGREWVDLKQEYLLGSTIDP